MPTGPYVSPRGTCYFLFAEQRKNAQRSNGFVQGHESGEQGMGFRLLNWSVTESGQRSRTNMTLTLTISGTGRYPQNRPWLTWESIPGPLDLAPQTQCYSMPLTSRSPCSRHTSSLKSPSNPFMQGSGPCRSLHLKHSSPCHAILHMTGSCAPPGPA